MTAMPELVAVLHSFVGLAAVLVGYANYLAPIPGVSGQMEEIGRAAGLTKQRIQQIESRAMAKLRHPARSQQLRDYLVKGIAPELIVAGDVDPDDVRALAERTYGKIPARGEAPKRRRP